MLGYCSQPFGIISDPVYVLLIKVDSHVDIEFTT